MSRTEHTRIRTDCQLAVLKEAVHEPVSQSGIWDKKVMRLEAIRIASDPLEEQVGGAVASQEKDEHRLKMVVLA